MAKQRAEISSWFRFCKDKIEKINKVWESKLGQNKETTDTDSDKNSDSEEDIDPNADRQTQMDNLFKNFGKQAGRTGKPLSKSFTGDSNSHEIKKDVEEGEKDLEKKAKDDQNTVKEAAKFGDNQYWRQPEMFSIDDLLAEQEEHDFPDVNPNPWGGKKEPEAIAEKSNEDDEEKKE